MGGRGRGPGRSGFAPQAPPRPGYECRRCGKSGHYIYNCPTNSDPNFDKGKGAGSAPLEKVSLESAGIPPLMLVNPSVGRYSACLRSVW